MIAIYFNVRLSAPPAPKSRSVINVQPLIETGCFIYSIEEEEEEEEECGALGAPIYQPVQCVYLLLYKHRSRVAQFFCIYDEKVVAGRSASFNRLFNSVAT